jgi:hypothetical protein
MRPETAARSSGRRRTDSLTTRTDELAVTCRTAPIATKTAPTIQSPPPSNNKPIRFSRNPGIAAKPLQDTRRHALGRPLAPRAGLADTEEQHEPGHPDEEDEDRPEDVEKRITTHDNHLRLSLP